MNRALVLGDTHGEWGQLYGACEAAAENQCDTIVQVGDWAYVWPSRPDPYPRLDLMLGHYDLRMLWLDGNHDQHDRIDHDAPEPVPTSERTTYLPRGVRFTLGDLSCLALGGAVSVDRHHRLEGQSWWRQETITWAQAERAVAGGTCDVMFTHDAPNTPELLARFDRSSGIPADLLREAASHRDLIDSVVDEVRPRRLVHGHYHWPYLAKRDGCTVIGLGCDGPSAWRVLECDRDHAPGEWVDA